MMILVDADGQILGRMSSEIAKLLKKGEEIVVINSEKCVVTGSKENVFSSYKKFLEIGDRYKGPFYPKAPERILRRTVRGMLPKNYSGREMLKNLRTYVGIPEEFKNKEAIRFKNADISKLKAKKFVRLLEISKVMGYG
jgi:large subunit ribosomal protein L13